MSDRTDTNTVTDPTRAVDPAYGVDPAIVAKARAIIVEVVGKHARTTSGDRKWLTGIEVDVDSGVGVDMPSHLAIESVIAALASLPCKSGEGAGEREAMIQTLTDFHRIMTKKFDPTCMFGETYDRQMMSNAAKLVANLPKVIAALTPDATQTREAELVAAAQAVLDNADRPGSRMQFGNDGDVWIDHKEVDQTVLDRLSAALSPQTLPAPGEVELRECLAEALAYLDKYKMMPKAQRDRFRAALGPQGDA